MISSLGISSSLVPISAESNAETYSDSGCLIKFWKFCFEYLRISLFCVEFLSSDQELLYSTTVNYASKLSVISLSSQRFAFSFCMSTNVMFDSVIITIIIIKVAGSF